MGGSRFSGKHVIVVSADSNVKLKLNSLFIETKVENKHFCESPKDAQTHLTKNSVDYVLIDIDLPFNNPIAFAKKVEEQSKAKSIIIGSVENLLKIDDSEDLKFETYAKPLSATDFIHEISTDSTSTDAGGERAPHPIEMSEESNFCKVNINDFISGREVQFDLFIKISAKKFVKLAHKGEAPSLERLKAYRDRNVMFLYIEKKDFKTYLGFNLKVAMKVTKEEKIPQEKKIALVKHVGEILVNSAFLGDLNPGIVSEGSVYVETAANVLSDSDDAFHLMSMLSTQADFVFAHSAAVSLYSVLIGKQIGWASPSTLFKVAMGGLLHDIGKREIGREILEKPETELTAEEIRLVESHVVRGAAILGKLTALPDDIIQVAMQHHENCLGHGYPVGLRKEAIHPMARLVFVANDFCNFALPSPNHEQLSPHDTITRMIKTSGSLYDPTFLVPLMELFKYKVPEKYKVFYGAAKKSA